MANQRDSDVAVVMTIIVVTRSSKLRPGRGEPVVEWMTRERELEQTIQAEAIKGTGNIIDAVRHHLGPIVGSKHSVSILDPHPFSAALPEVT